MVASGFSNEVPARDAVASRTPHEAPRPCTSAATSITYAETEDNKVQQVRPTAHRLKTKLVADGLALDLNLDVVADHHAAGLQHRAVCDAELLTVDLTLAVKPKTSLPNGFVVTPSNSTLSSTGTVVSLMVRSRFLPPPPATDGC
jgi:hypothetical protein